LFSTKKEAHIEADLRNGDATVFVCSKCNDEKFDKPIYSYRDTEWVNCSVHGDTLHKRQSIKELEARR
jgi:hypothetical protein